ncbi:MAG: DUF1830 domain-containing protein [Coleofasciculaceae cyanobacterium]
MNQLLHTPHSEYNERILCCYVNGTSNTLVAKVTNIPNWRFERVVFPNERFLFEAPPTAELEIHRNTPSGKVLSDKVTCNYLRVNDLSKTVQAKAHSKTPIATR